MNKPRYLMRLLSALFAVASIFDPSDSFSQVNQQATREKITSVITTNNRKEITAFDMRDVLFDVLSYASKMTPTLTIAQLRAGKADTASVVYIRQGRRSGQFTYDPADQISADDGAITLRAGNRVYKRDMTDHVNIEWFGAIPDDGISDRQAIIDAMNAAVPRNKRIGVPLGNFHIGGIGASHISLISNTHIFGYDRDGSKITLIDSTNKAFFVAINRKNISIRNLTLEGGKQNFTTVSVQLDRVENGFFDNLVVNDLKQAFYVYGSGSVPSRKLDFNKIYFKRVYDFAIRAKDNMPEDITITDCTVDSVLNNTAFGETSAFRIMGRNIRVIRPKVYYTYDTGIMISGVNNDGVLVQEAYIRSKQVSIFVGTGARNVSVLDSDLSSSNDHAIHAYNPGAGVLFAGNKYEGNRLHDCAKSGLYIEGSTGNIVNANFIYRNGKRGDVAVRERTGITIIPNTADANSANNQITNNMIWDDQVIKTMQRGISVETVSIAGLTIENNVIEDVSDANKVYYAANVVEKNLFSLRAKIETPSQTLTSRPLSAGEFSNENRPVATLWPNGNAMFWNRTLKGFEYSNGTEWIAFPTTKGFVQKASNDTISGQKTFTAMANFSGPGPQVKFSYDSLTYVNLSTSSSGNLTITPSGSSPTITLAGHLVTGMTNSNLYIPNNTGIGPTTTAGGYQFGTSTSVQFREGFRGTTNGVITSGNNYANLIVGASPVTSAPSGSHGIFASAAFIAPAITLGGAPVSIGATVVIHDEPTAGTSNYGLLNRAKSRFLGLARFDSDIEFNDIGEGVIVRSANGTKWRIIVNDSGQVSAQSVP